MERSHKDNDRIIEHLLASGDRRKIQGLSDVLSAHDLTVKQILDEIHDDRVKNHLYKRY